MGQKNTLAALMNDGGGPEQLSVAAIGQLIHEMAIKLADPEETAKIFEGVSMPDEAVVQEEMVMLRLIAASHGASMLLTAVRERVLEGYWNAHERQRADLLYEAIAGVVSTREDDYMPDKPAKGNDFLTPIGQAFARHVGADPNDKAIVKRAGAAWYATQETSMLFVAQLLGDLWKGVSSRVGG